MKNNPPDASASKEGRGTANILLRTLQGETGLPVPFQELEVGAPHVAAVLGRPLGEISTELPAQDYVEFTRLTGQHALYYNALWKAGRVYLADSNGRRHYVNGFVRTRSDFARLEPFDLGPAQERLAALTAAAAREDLAVIVNFASPFRLALFAMGYEEFFLRLYDDPAFIADLIAYFSERAAQYLAVLLRYPVDAFCMAVSVCAGNGPLISAEMLKTFWLENTLQYLKPVAARQLPVILHVDGDFSTISDLLLELPAAAIHPFEIAGQLSIEEFKKRHGRRIAVWGNIDLGGVLTRGASEEVRADVRRHIERLAPGGRYILGSSHEITPDVPLENFQALVAAAREFGNEAGI